VSLDGRFDHAREAYVFTTDQGAAVYHVLTPLRTGDGKVLMVDRGEVPKEKLDPASRAAGNVDGEAHVTGVWRVPDAPGAFTPPPDTSHRIWFARDLASIAAADHLSLTAPVVIEADATPNPGGWPKGGQTVVSFRNQHLSYAVTWFGLALCLLGVWLPYHISRGRIAFR
jgi:surfeit locus 1 family protein